MAEFAPGSVDLVFADPPFNIGYDYDVYDDRRSVSEYLGWSSRWIKEVHRCLTPTGTFWLAIGDEFAAELKIAAQDAGFVCRSWVIWYYTFGVNCARGFSRSHTHIFHFVKDPDEFTFNADNPAVRMPSARQLIYADNRANPKGRLPDNTWIYRPKDGPIGAFAPGHDTWYFARVAGTFRERQGFHGCQMPEQLLGRIIRLSSKPGDVVFDPFAGSGTTLAVAKKLGRQWLGTELSKDYVQQVIRRVGSVNTGDPLDGPSDPTKSAPNASNGKSKYSIHHGQTIPLPKATEDVHEGVIAAYNTVSQGNSADYLLCDPDMSAAFRRECKRLGIPGSGFFWNRILLRLRKSKRLPKASNRHKRYTFEEMDAYSFASEIALRQLEIDYGMASDDVLCSPDAIVEFDRIAAEFAPGHSVFEYRWAALAIRKRATASRRIALEKFGDWERKKPLPSAMPMTHLSLDKMDMPGAYILEGRDNTNSLYVGEARNVANRVKLIEETEQWERLGLSAIRFLPNESNDAHGLQSMLVRRMSPMLNSALLYPETQIV